MKKIDFDKKYFTISIYALMVIVAAIFIDRVLTGFDISNALKIILNVMSPFIIGLFIAYFLNTPVKFFERVLPKKLKSKKARHLISVIVTYLITAGAVVWVIAYLVPEVGKSIKALFSNMPRGVENLQLWLSNYLDVEEVNLIDFLYQTIFRQSDIMSVVNSVVDPFLKGAAYIPDLLSKLLTGTFGFASSVINFLIGLMVSFYMLCDKESFAKQATKIICALFKRPTSEKIIAAAKNSNMFFEKFFIGKAIDSLIIGILYFIFSLIFNFPYAVLNSLIVGVTNMIPYFGPFIGAVPVILIVCLSNPVQALWVALFILVLQQFDGIILGPRILGDSTGLKPIWVIFAITVGGYFFGVVGMFLGVPVFAVIRVAFSSFIDKKYNENQ